MTVIFISLVVSGVLMSIMGYRYMKSGKFMPAGLVAGLRYAFCRYAECALCMLHSFCG